MSAAVSQITSLAIVYSFVCSGADQRKHQSSASLAFVRGIHRWPVNTQHKGPVTRNVFLFGDVIMQFETPCWTRLINPGASELLVNWWSSNLVNVPKITLFTFWLCFDGIWTCQWYSPDLSELKYLHIQVLSMAGDCDRYEELEVGLYLSKPVLSYLHENEVRTLERQLRPKVVIVPTLSSSVALSLSHTNTLIYI